MKKTFIVEFIGIAGVGKSTIVRELHDKIRYHNINSYNMNVERIPLKKKVSLKIFFNTFLLIANIKFTKKIRIIKSFKAVYDSQVRMKYFKNIYGVHLSDQGIFQAIMAIRKYTKNDNKINRWFHNKIYKSSAPHLLIILNTDTQTIIERRKKRDGVTLEREDVEREQENLKKIEKEAFEISSIDNRFNYVYVINERIDKIDEVVSNIYNHINNNITR